MGFLTNERDLTLAKMGAAEENVDTFSLTVTKTCQRLSTEGSGRKILRAVGTADMSIGQCFKNQLERKCYWCHRNENGHDQPNM